MSSYQVIARKYRPQRFSDVVGQDHVTQTLANAIRQNRIAHAYLFVGPRGTGKTTLARILAKCLNCVAGPKEDFPDDDPRCQEIAEGRALDVLEIDGASNRGIDEIRALRDTVRYAPSTCRFKIYIIDEVHMLTKEAFNALLKTLEEPPPHVKFIFATTEPEKILPTILSRCQRFDLRRIPTALIAKELARIAKLEGIQAEDAALFAIARGADGGMRDAESALDQLMSFSGDQVKEEDVLAMFGLAARGQILQLARSLARGDGEAVLRFLDELAKAGKDLGRLLSDLLLHFRNLLIFQVSRGDLGLLDVSETEAAMLKADADLIDSKALARVMEVLALAEGTLRNAASKRIFIEVTLLKAIDARQAIEIDTLLARLGNLRGDAATGSEVLHETRPPAFAAAPTKPKVSDAAAQTATAVDLGSIWRNVLAGVGRASPFAKSYLLEAHPVSLMKNLFTIGFDPEFAEHISLVDNSKNRTLIQTKLHELGLGELMVKFVVAERPTNWSSEAAGNDTREEGAGSNQPAPVGPATASKPANEAPSPAPVRAANEPLIQQAIDLFEGTIVEVRS